MSTKREGGAAAVVDQAGADTCELVLPITGMTCANCAATVERTLRRTEGVREASVPEVVGVAVGFRSS